MVLFLITYVSCLMMTGLVWLIQLVHYPLFKHVGQVEFPYYERQHVFNISFIVVPLMTIELGSAIFLVFKPWMLSSNMAYISLGMLLLIWLSTFLFQIPTHNALTLKYDNSAIEKLVKTNWIRTILWTLRSIMLTLLLAEALRTYFPQNWF